MRRTVLIKILKKGGFVFERHGGSHDVYIRGDVREIIPRHREINERVAKAILSRNNLS